jgi:hypothetical protein
MDAVWPFVWIGSSASARMDGWTRPYFHIELSIMQVDLRNHVVLAVKSMQHAVRLLHTCNQTIPSNDACVLSDVPSGQRFNLEAGRRSCSCSA